MSEFRMPSLGADMESGTLVEWKVKPGDTIKKGDIVAVVETAKGVVEIEIFDTGVVDEVYFQPGQEVPVGQVLAMVLSPEERAAKGSAAPSPAPAAATAAEAVAAAPAAETPAAAAPAAPPQAASGGGEGLRVSPLARRIAAELNVDLSTVQGTGPGGAIQRVDIERAAQAVKTAPAPAQAPAPPAAPPPAPAPAAAPQPAPSAPSPEAKKPADFQTAMRQAIALAMARSNREIPHYYLETRIDMSKALSWLEEQNLKRSVGERLLLAVVLIKAVALALTEVPELNGFWKDDQHVISEEIHIAFAIALRQGGLITPAVHNADMKSWDELRETLNDLIMRTRAGRLRSSELTDGTITLTSLGDRGVEKTFGVIYPPQVGLVGFGKVMDQAWVENGMLGIRPVVVATLAGDHRATDGRRGAQFLEALNKRLQEVENL